MAVKKLGVRAYQDVIGKEAAINGQKGTIVGVVKDFHNKSLHESIDPIYITTRADDYVTCCVKINLANPRPMLAAIKTAWERTFPEHVYKYDFLDGQIARCYGQDQIFLRLIQAFVSVSILIRSLGLYGLASFMAYRKTKEVGVCKVLGASIQSIVWLFGREFIQLLLIAFAIAAPLAWWLMNNWLENFAYRIEVGAGVFAMAMLLTILIAELTVGYQAFKAAMTNPVDSLRDE